ncbi:hypothetical protein [Chondromyces crocatus]|uniref:Glycosyltransferase RgtA/B/C/D-like domain-containing protein n=1 Tax=Chondromyces crocatus TaxID=52 RepID=A0A0K1EGD2_CHOCO|nr:hypothetical protein [Chondromyces crocatus]AKT39909.1 uncharacterized protein CMC5_040600 [Chondromyces crocatus]
MQGALANALFLLVRTGERIVSPSIEPAGLLDPLRDYSATPMGSWLLLLALTTLAALAALALSLRAEPAGRAETGVLFTATFFALIVTPVFALGYTHALRPIPLAITSLLLSLSTLLATAPDRSASGLHAHATTLARAALALAGLPFVAIARALRERSFTALGLAVAALAIAFSAWLTYLAPSESWDGFFYHEPIIGFALQHHGFRMVDLPPHMVVQAANGYPRACEAFALWFVLFTDRTLIEIGNTAAAPGLMLVTFVLARRYTSDRVSAMGWSAALLLMPAMLTQLRTSLIDVQVTFFLLAAVHHATRPTLRFRDAAACVLCLALLLASKSTGLAWAPPVALVLFGRLFLHHARTRLAPALGLLLASAAFLLGTAALTFARNWTAFGNPLWPVSYENPALHIDWPGLVTLDELSPKLSLRDLIQLKYGRPIPGIADALVHDYGHGVPWIVVPLALLALLATLLTALRARLTRSPEPRTDNLLLVIALGAALLVASPSLAIARYNGHLVAIAMVTIAAWAGRRRTRWRLHEGAIAATLTLTLLPWLWTGWFFGLDLEPRHLPDLLRSTPEERASMNVATFQMPPDVARAREQELGPGTLVVFTQDLAFPGVLWNHAMSNRVEHVRYDDVASFLSRLDTLKPTWVVVADGSAARTALNAEAHRWERVGVATKEGSTVAFRRRKPRLP